MSATPNLGPDRATARRHRVLVADRDETEGAVLAELFTQAGFLVDVTRDGSSVLAALSARVPDVLLGSRVVRWFSRRQASSTARTAPART